MLEAAEALGDVSRRRGGGVGELIAKFEVSRDAGASAQRIGKLVDLDRTLPRCQIFEPPHPSHNAS
jgi:hypothetical protein